jgi:hypothetical protein
MTKIKSVKTMRLEKELSTLILSLCAALLIFSASDLLTGFGQIQSILGDSTFNASRIGDFFRAIFVAFLSAVMIPAGSLYLVITGFRKKNNYRWVLTSTIFSSSLLALAVLANSLFLIPDFNEDTYVPGPEAFIILFLRESSFGATKFGMRELLILFIVFAIAATSLYAILSQKKKPRPLVSK